MYLYIFHIWYLYPVTFVFHIILIFNFQHLMFKYFCLNFVLLWFCNVFYCQFSMEASGYIVKYCVVIHRRCSSFVAWPLAVTSAVACVAAVTAAVGNVNLNPRWTRSPNSTCPLRTWRHKWLLMSKVTTQKLCFIWQQFTVFKVSEYSTHWALLSIRCLWCVNIRTRPHPHLQADVCSLFLSGWVRWWWRLFSVV